MMPAAAAAPPDATTPRTIRIIILAALPLEVRPFLRHLRARRRRDLGLPAWEFAAGEIRGLAAASGMGPDAARLTAESFLARWRPEMLISVGFGGALTPELSPGSLVLGESFWHYDPRGAVLSRAPSPSPPRPLPHLLGCLAESGLPVFAGSMISSPGIIHKERQGGPLRHLPHPVLDLETAIMAAAAAAQDLPFLSLRVITDAAGEEIPEFLRDAGSTEGDVHGLNALGWVAADPRRLLTLWRLWRRSREAAAQLARALLVLLPQLSAGQ